MTYVYIIYNMYYTYIICIFSHIDLLGFGVYISFCFNSALCNF